ncbi:MAG: hypothetical protein ACOCQD_03855 [archaeon]
MSKSKKKKNKKYVSWEFDSSEFKFNGEKILKDAREHGVHLLHVKRGNSECTYVTREYEKRCTEVNIFLRSAFDNNVPIATFMGFMNSIVDKNFGFKLLVQINISPLEGPRNDTKQVKMSPEELHNEVLRREQLKATTIRKTYVRGWA